jgi:hypothetical protein
MNTLTHTFSCEYLYSINIYLFSFFWSQVYNFQVNSILIFFELGVYYLWINGFYDLLFPTFLYWKMQNLDI